MRGDGDTATIPRVRGRSARRFVAVLGGLACVVASVLAVRALSLRGLPDIGDPFDVASFDAEPIPDDENAFTFYRRAHDQATSGDNSPLLKGVYTDGTMVDGVQLAHLEANRPALATWLEGTKRDRAAYVRVSEATFETTLPVAQRMREFCRLANLEAFRLQQSGDLAGAWTWIRGNLRAGRHVGTNGFVIERLVGISLFDVAARQARHWADDPKVDAALLRRALSDALDAEALSPPASSSAKAEYLIAMNSLNDPDVRWRCYEDLHRGDGRTAWRAAKLRLDVAIATSSREPERSRRVFKMVTANWLSAADLPAAERAKRLVVRDNLALYRSPSGDVPLPIEEITRHYDSSVYARVFLSSWAGIDRSLNRDEANRASLIVHLAEQLYLREHGKAPASPDMLVGPYLKALPTGYVPPPADPTAPVNAK